MMQKTKLPTGSNVLDKFLEGGIEKGIISTIYGPAGSGKTTIALIVAIEIAKAGKKVFFVDTEGGFSIERFLQLCNNDTELLRNILIMKPLNFDEQGKTIENIKKNINDKFGLVVVDTISMQYRVEVSKKKDVKNMNNKLGLQIAYLNEIARENNIPVIVTNQVYSDFDLKDQVRMVGGDILKYNSKCLIELSNNDNIRKATIRQHRSLPENHSVDFKIINTGLEKIQPLIKTPEDDSE